VGPAEISPIPNQHNRKQTSRMLASIAIFTGMILVTAIIFAGVFVARARVRAQISRAEKMESSGCARAWAVIRGQQQQKGTTPEEDVEMQRPGRGRKAGAGGRAVPLLQLPRITMTCPSTSTVGL
jgi:hypothetical protein